MNILWRRTLSVTPLRNLPVNKRLKNLAEFNLLQNLHLCTQKSVCATNFGPLGEIGANFSLQFSLRTQFAKISNKKVIAENQCEKHKKSSLVLLFVLDRDISKKKALKMTGHFQIFRAFFCPPDHKSEKKSRKSTNKKNSGLSMLANSDTTSTRICLDQDHTSASL